MNTESKRVHIVEGRLDAISLATAIPAETVLLQDGAGTSEVIGITWPERLTVHGAKKLARKINAAMNIGHNRALHAIAVRYGFESWIACLAAISTDQDRAEKKAKSMRIQQRRARKWSQQNSDRWKDNDALAASSPGWNGKHSATARLPGHTQPADSIAAAVVFTPEKL
ncbi:MAG TPA: toprim domain-containing protein [Candidatus Sulfotelmatobacter sp.]|jgi:hypothetical protein|nr:toprim domain-containing protein [Candidatus Sulfotelmatobacter sp.]